MRKIRDGMSVFRAKFWDYNEDKCLEYFIIALDFDDALDMAKIFISEEAEDKEFKGKEIGGTKYGLFGLWEEMPATVLMRAAT